MLKNIPQMMPPELMKIMLEMGHGDELLLCDGNYPKSGSPERCVRMDGHGISEILDMILQFLPLDPYVEHPTTLMAVVPGDPYKPEIWDEYRKIGKQYEADGLREESIERQAFYEKGRRCYACVATGEKTLYANIILKKGVVK
jgi:L-fucose mutarotase